MWILKPKWQKQNLAKISVSDSEAHVPNHRLMLMLKLVIYFMLFLVSCNRDKNKNV